MAPDHIWPLFCMQWRIYIWHDQWEPDWKGPVIAAVVVIAVVCFLLVFSVLLSW